jgi:short chain dehydrogenase
LVFTHDKTLDHDELDVYGSTDMAIKFTLRRSLMNTPVVLITGALTGIGRGTALAFAREGARIVVSGRHDEEGKKLVDHRGADGSAAVMTANK